jgi:DNA-binding HxlR family transcriptional regulator
VSRVTRRSYRQFCGLAAALDVVGERWALLIVRDLTPGARRFSDLFAGLPGIATDVLTERLRSLEAAGAVRRTAVTTPVPGTVYELTDRGRQLADVAGRLAEWGVALLPDQPSEHRLDARWALATMCRGYRGGLADGDYRWTIDGHQMTVDVAAERARLRYGHGDAPAVLAVTCTSVDFFRLVARGDPATALASVEVSGEQDALDQFVAALPLGIRPGR